jgi:pre-rRNA-processing protein TSR3
MSLFPPTIILRHRKENLKKCSLRGLESRPDMLFFTYPKAELPSLNGYLLLTLDGPPLSPEDQSFGLFLIDGTWRHTTTMLKQLVGPHLFQKRSLPSHFQTAYPRTQQDCSDPTRGLASVEALFLAYSILGRETEGLLDHYYWRADFLKKNDVVSFPA